MPREIGTNGLWGSFDPEKSVIWEWPLFWSVLLGAVGNEVTQSKSFWQLLSTCYTLFQHWKRGLLLSPFYRVEDWGADSWPWAQPFNLQMILPKASLSYSPGLISPYLSNFWLPLCSVSKESAHNAGDPGSIPGSGWREADGNGNLPPWRRKWASTPVFLPRAFHGQRSLVDCSPWGHKESDTTEQLHFHFYLSNFRNSISKVVFCVILSIKWSIEHRWF